MMKRRWIIGIDEAGRGPFAGPVTLAVFVAPRRLGAWLFRGIRDSKKLSARQREEWLGRFKSDPRVFYHSTSVGPRSIDRLGIAVAIRRGLKRMLSAAAQKHESVREGGAEIIQLDGSLFAPESYRQETIIKGDERVPVIAAASIIAKVRRDRYMIRIAKKYPQYGFEIHKGYGTALHRERIREHGLSDVHRRSYCAKYAR